MNYIFLKNGMSRVRLSSGWVANKVCVVVVHIVKKIKKINVSKLRNYYTFTSCVKMLFYYKNQKEIFFFFLGPVDI